MSTIFEAVSTSCKANSTFYSTLNQHVLTGRVAAVQPVTIGLQSRYSVKVCCQHLTDFLILCTVGEMGGIYNGIQKTGSFLNVPYKLKSDFAHEQKKYNIRATE